MLVRALLLSLCLCVSATAQQNAGIPQNAEWRQPFPAFRMIGNVYWVGTYDLSTYLITTDAGHILINTGFGDTVPLPAKLERLARLQSRQRAIQEQRNRRFLGRTVEVLVEGKSKRDPSRWTGRTADNRIVHFGADTAAGRLEHVRIAQTTPYFLYGAPVAT